MLKSLPSAIASAIASAICSLAFGACSTVKPVGALKTATETMGGKPLISDEEMRDRSPNTSHIPDDEVSRGFLQWKAE